MVWKGSPANAQIQLNCTACVVCLLQTGLAWVEQCFPEIDLAERCVSTSALVCWSEML